MTVSGFVGYYYMASVHNRYIQVRHDCEDGNLTVMRPHWLILTCHHGEDCTFPKNTHPSRYLHYSARKIFISLHWNKTSNQSVETGPRFMQ